MKRFIRSFLALAVLAATPLAQAAPATPEFQQGVHVYSSPEGFFPTGFGIPQAQAVEEFARTLPIPSYVVLVNSDGYRIEPHILGDGFATKWASQGLDSERFLILTVAWSSDCDRKPFYRRSGKDFCQVGFSMPETLGAVYPHSTQSSDRKAYFIPKVAKSPQDLKGGIINTLRAAISRVWPQIDPVQIAARKFRAAQTNYLEMLGKAQGLLAARQHHPSTGVGAYEAAYQQALAVKDSTDPDTLIQATQELNTSMEPLRLSVQQAQFALILKILLLTLAILAFPIVLGFLLRLLYRRFVLFTVLRENLETALREWDEKLSHAQAKYTEFHFKDREDLVAFDDVVGETRKLYDWVTSSIDTIYMNILGLERHVRRCEELGRTATFFKVQPLRDALAALAEPFSMDTAEVNSSDLFGGETVKITVDPIKFAAEQANTFRKAKEGWDTLKRAAEARMQEAEKAFPHRTMDRLFKMCEAAGMPNTWVDDHPLYGDDESDAAFYQTINSVRWADPLAYLKRLEELAEMETAILARIQEVSEIIQRVEKSRVTQYEDIDTRVDPKNDPKVTLDTAMSAEDRFQAMLQTAASSKDIKALQVQADRVETLYRKVRGQVAEIQAAVRGIAAARKGAEDARQNAALAFRAANLAVSSARQVHTDMLQANRNIEAGEIAQSGASIEFTSAEEAVAANRHLDACRLFSDAQRSWEKAKASFNDASAHCKTLDRRKAAFEKKLSQMESLRSSKAHKIREFGGTANLSYQAPLVGRGLVDYAALLLSLDSQEKGWDRLVRTARQRYEEEQARLRREEERRREEEARHRRRRQEEEDRRRRSRYHSSTSSFGGGSSWGSTSSFGGGSSWGSSSSFGGGGGSFGGSDGW